MHIYVCMYGFLLRMRAEQFISYSECHAPNACKIYPQDNPFQCSEECDSYVQKKMQGLYISCPVFDFNKFWIKLITSTDISGSDLYSEAIRRRKPGLGNAGLVIEGKPSIPRLGQRDLTLSNRGLE